MRRNLGLSGQYAAVDEKLTAFENLHMVGRLYGMNRRSAAARANELLESFWLTDVAGKRSGTFSGGMRRRLDLAGAIVARPKVVVLDEPTTGLDPRGRLDTWDVVSSLVADGTTVLLTTQYLEEADRLADHIAVINHGRVIAEGTAAELKQSAGTRTDRRRNARRRRPHRGRGRAGAGLRSGFPGRTGPAEPARLHRRPRRPPAAGPGPVRTGRPWLAGGRGLPAPPHLDDVFLRLTGHAAAAPGSLLPRKPLPEKVEVSA